MKLEVIVQFQSARPLLRRKVGFLFEGLSGRRRRKHRSYKQNRGVIEIEAERLQLVGVHRKLCRLLHDLRSR